MGNAGNFAFCERCHGKLKGDDAWWLVLDQRTGTYALGVPEKFSQGAFPFGKDCAQIETERHKKALELLMSPKRRSQLVSVLKLIIEYRTENKISPSVRDIAEYFINPITGHPSSTNTVNKWVEKLIALRWIKRVGSKHSARAIVETDRGMHVYSEGTDGEDDEQQDG